MDLTNYIAIKRPTLWQLEFYSNITYEDSEFIDNYKKDNDIVAMVSGEDYFYVLIHDKNTDKLAIIYKENIYRDSFVKSYHDKIEGNLLIINLFIKLLENKFTLTAVLDLMKYINCYCIKNKYTLDLQKGFGIKVIDDD